MARYLAHHNLALLWTQLTCSGEGLNPECDGIVSNPLQRTGHARKASVAKVSYSFSLPDEFDDLLAKLIVGGVDRQGCRLVIVSGEAQKSRTL